MHQEYAKGKGDDKNGHQYWNGVKNMEGYFHPENDEHNGDNNKIQHHFKSVNSHFNQQ